MKIFNNITDEQLAAFIDGNVSKQEADEILDVVQSEDDLETLALAFSAKAELETDEEPDDMPEITLLNKTAVICRFEPLPMAGFLGNETSDKGDETEE
jgi:hypothetical protein